MVNLLVKLLEIWCQVLKSQKQFVQSCSDNLKKIASNFGQSQNEQEL
jgi:hypothetical protein